MRTGFTFKTVCMAGMLGAAAAHAGTVVLDTTGFWRMHH